jgi:acetylornithine deacetylase/succinyl-diaminopimelate desuccinylase-like protein
MYGHLDKQPPLEPWAEGLGPYNPVIRDGKLYGRGGADGTFSVFWLLLFAPCCADMRERLDLIKQDGYSVFAAITALRALQLQKLPHARAVIIIEACEESGSPDLPFYIEHLKPRIGIPDLIICLDSGCGTYDQFWITTTLRGMIAGVLRVEILKEAQHSGMASGVVPSSFRIARQILSKLEDEKTGEVLFSGLQCEIPEERKKQIQHCADVLGETIYSNFKFVDGAEPVTKDPAQALANKTWKATVSVIGTDGIPSLENAGNVLRTYTSLKLSIRVPPRVSALPCARALKEFLEKDPPYGAKVTFEFDKAGSGWDAPYV